MLSSSLLLNEYGEDAALGVRNPGKSAPSRAMCQSLPNGRVTSLHRGLLMMVNGVLHLNSLNQGLLSVVTEKPWRRNLRSQTETDPGTLAAVVVIIGNSLQLFRRELDWVAPCHHSRKSH